MTDWILPNRLMFTNWIYKKFHPSKYIAEKSHFQADPSQRLIADYINYESPYRGILVYHGLGTGKTCTAILTTDSFVYKKQKVIVLLPASLENNYRKELGKCSRTGSLLRGKWNLLNLSMRDDMDLIDLIYKKTGIDRSFMAERNGVFWIPAFIEIPEASILEKNVSYKDMKQGQQKSVYDTYYYLIDKRYTFLHYNGLTNKNLEAMEKEDIFDNAIVVIDEVHTFISRVVNGGKIARRLYNMMIAKANIRFVLLSGTPVINHPFELAYTLNLLRGPITEYSISTLKNMPLTNLQAFLEKEKLYQHIDTIDLDETGTQATITLLPKGFVRKSTAGNEITQGPYYKDGETFMKRVLGVLKGTYNMSTKIKTTVNKAFPDKKEVFLEYFFDMTVPNTPVVNKENQELFMRRLQGLVSYYRISDESMFPKTLEPEYKKIPMSEQQFSYYAKRRNEEIEQEDLKTKKETQMRKKGTQVDLFQTNSSYRAYSRMACNFVFPQSIQRPFPKDIRMKILRKEVDISEEDDDDEEETEKTKPNETKLYEMEVKKALDALDERYLTGEGLKECSPKMHTLLEDLTQNTRVKSLLYSQFRTVEGLYIFRRVLNYADWVEIDFRPLGDGDWEIINADTVLQSQYDYKRFLVFGSREKSDMLIALYNADIKNLPKTVKKQLSDFSENLRGELVSLLMITQSGAEGLNLRNVRYVYILEPFWNQVRIDQVIGRAIRKRSHLELPEDEQNVKVVMYISSLTPNQVNLNKTIKMRDEGRTTDEDIFSIATRKNKIISQFLTMLKSNSIDCIFHAPENKPAVYGYKCHVPPINENLNKLTYNPNIEVSTKVFGVKERLKKINGRAVMKDSVKYVKLPDNETLYDYPSYKYAGVLIDIPFIKPEKEAPELALPKPAPPKKQVAPEPAPPKQVAPEQVAPEPTSPKPVAPETAPPKPVAPKKQVAPEPVAPEPAAPKKVAPKKQVAPEPASKRVLPQKQVAPKPASKRVLLKKQVPEPLKPASPEPLTVAPSLNNLRNMPPHKLKQFEEQMKVGGPIPQQICGTTKQPKVMPINKRLALFGLELVDDALLQNGGNCQFVAFLDQLKQHKILPEDTLETPETLREESMNWLENNFQTHIKHINNTSVYDYIETYDVDPRTYIKKMKKPLEWGDEISLLALCGLYNVETYVIGTSLIYAQPIKPPSWTESTQRQLRGRLFIGSVTDKHYVSTRPLYPLTCV